jgi:putative ABC transport system permease protein
MANWFRKIPLAWLQLTRQKTRFAVALAGIAFADVLMFLQMGFEGALYEAAMKPYATLQADLIMANPQFQTLFAVKSSPRERLLQTLGYEGVAAVSPLYISSAQWRNPTTTQTRTILVWGIDPGSTAFSLPDVQQQVDPIKQLDRVLFDRAGRPEYGAIADTFSQQGPFEVQLNSKTVQVAGLFTIGASFAADGNVITSDSTFMRLFPDRTPDQIEAGLIHLQPGADVKAVQASLKAGLPNDVVVLTPQEFAEVEKQYWANGTGIGFIFQMGVGMGFIVGIVIVYQILYSDVSDHLPEYATLKAMGYTDNYLLSVLIQEALMLAVFGFIPSFALSWGMYQLAYAATLLPIAMTVERATNVFILTVVMCSVSGAIALRKLRSADPADVF